MSEKCGYCDKPICKDRDGNVLACDCFQTQHELMTTRALTAERELAELKERTQGVCHWRLTMDDWNLWEGDCGVAWDFEDDDPTVNGMEYCPKCGRKLVQLPELPEASHD